MAKRQRSDSITAAVTSFESAGKDVAVPDWVNVPEPALKFWRSITRARAADRWNDSDLENAAELARTKASIERLNTELALEGDIIKNDRGTPIVNPKHSLLETLTRRMVALSRMLQVHAEATQGKARDQVPANKGQAKAQDALEATSNSSLIPRRSH